MSKRREILRGVAALPLAALLADPRLARAAAAGLEPVTTKLPDGSTVAAALAVPEGDSRAGVLLVHEWWGLNDQIKSVAADLAGEGYLSLAVDLYDGKVTDQPDEARKLTRSVNPERATATLVAWLNWLRRDPRSHGKLATIGWCFGGGWSLNASLAAPVDATVVYYGRVDKSAAELAPLQGPVLGQFATRDKWINHAMVNGFTAAMKAAGKSLETHWYNANHAFANPTTARYDAADAALAWRRTLDFLQANLGT